MYSLGRMHYRSDYLRRNTISAISQMSPLWLPHGKSDTSASACASISHASGKQTVNCPEFGPQSPRLEELPSAAYPTRRHTICLGSTIFQEEAKSSNHSKTSAETGQGLTCPTSAPDELPSTSERESLQIRNPNTSSVALVDSPQLPISIGDGYSRDQLPSVPQTLRDSANEKDGAKTTTQPAEHQRNASSLALAWQKEIAYDERVMRTLGKNRFLAYQLEVPPDARARFEKIKGAFDADVKRLIASVSSHNQIPLSYRLYMVGIRKGRSITAEPTLVLSCGSQKWKHIIKRKFLRIQPHYLEDLGMSLLVHYERSPVILAAKSEAGSDDVIAIPQSNWHQGFKAIYLPRKPSTTFCGLRIKIAFEITGPNGQISKQKNSAMIGGIMRINGVWYGLTTAHSFRSQIPTLTQNNPDESLYQASDPNGSSETSDDANSISDKSHSYPRYLSQVGIPESFLDRNFVRLDAVSPGKQMAYSFHGESMSVSGVSTLEAINSDWAAFELPDAYIPTITNSYCSPTENRRGGSVQETSLRCVNGPSQMESGNVQILCDARQPRSGYLSMNIVSFQDETHTLDVQEIFLDQPIPAGSSGSWVVRNDRLYGMVVAICDGGNSCFMIPMGEVLQGVESVFKRGIEFYTCTSSLRLTDADSHAQTMSSRLANPSESTVDEDRPQRIPQARWDVPVWRGQPKFSNSAPSDRTNADESGKPYKGGTWVAKDFLSTKRRPLF